MGAYERISGELRTFFSEHSIMKILLPLDVVFVFAGGIFLLISALFPRWGLSTGFFGNILFYLAYWGFFLGLILAFANNHQMFLYSGCFMFGAYWLIYFLKNIKSFRLGYLIPVAIFGGLGYLVFKKNSSAVNVDENANV